MVQNLQGFLATLAVSTLIIKNLTNCQEFQTDNSCPSGTCLQPNDCTRIGGKISTHCNDTDGHFCCDFSENIQDSCNAIKTGAGNIYFKSPGYPEFYGGSLVCQFQLNLDKNSVGLKLEFIDLNLPGHYDTRIFENTSMNKSNFLCDSDWFFIKGFPDWMPDPRCGNLTGYSTIIEIDIERYQRQVTVVFIMSSDRYKWNIKLSQISSNKVRKIDFCLVSRMEQWNKQIGREYFNNSQSNFSNPQPVDHTYLGGSKIEKNPPWQVNIRQMIQDNLNTSMSSNSKNRIKGSPLCTGTIIDDRHVLTSSSCFLTKYYGTPKYGLKYLKVFTQNGSIYDIETLTFHFNFGSSPFVHDDIAVIRTKISIPFTKQIRPVGIPRKDRFLSNFNNQGNSTTNQDKEMPRFIIPNCFPKDQKTSLFSIFNETDCSEIRRKEFETLNVNVSGLESIGKYSGVLKHWICLQYRGPIVKAGCPLINLDSKGKNPVLIGIFNHFSGPGVGLPLNAEILDTAYFTKIQAYWKWILMSIS